MVYKNLIITLAIAFMSVWNIEGVMGKYKIIPDWIRGAGFIFRIDQRWAMFSPEVRKEDGWFVMKANLVNGETVDVFQPEHNINSDSGLLAKPENMLTHFKQDRWRKYFESWMDNKPIRQGLADYLCRAWNEAHSELEHIKDLQIVFIEELSSGYLEKPKTTQKIIFEHQP